MTAVTSDKTCKYSVFSSCSPEHQLYYKILNKNVLNILFTNWKLSVGVMI